MVTAIFTQEIDKSGTFHVHYFFPANKVARYLAIIARKSHFSMEDIFLLQKAGIQVKVEDSNDVLD